jgi:hypothetical protein
MSWMIPRAQRSRRRLKHVGYPQRGGWKNAYGRRKEWSKELSPDAEQNVSQNSNEAVPDTIVNPSMTEAWKWS